MLTLFDELVSATLSCHINIRYLLIIQTNRIFELKEHEKQLLYTFIQPLLELIP